MDENKAEYAVKYQASRAGRATEKSAVFLPMETLTEIKTNEQNLSVSISGSGSGDIYISKAVSLYRAVKVKYKWLIIPTTVSKVFERAEFEKVFCDLLEVESFDDEEFWVIRAKDITKLQRLIEELDLNNSFREMYQHEYLPGLG